MKVSASLRNIKEISAASFVLRFFYGGIVAVLTGLIAQHFGPKTGGYFLALPAIFPASASLIVKQMRERKAATDPGWRRWTNKVISLEARGTVHGSAGMVAFAICLWWSLPRYTPVTCFILSLSAWLMAAVVLWYVIAKLRHVTGAR